MTAEPPEPAEAPVPPELPAPAAPPEMSEPAEETSAPRRRSRRAARSFEPAIGALGQRYVTAALVLAALAALYGVAALSRPSGAPAGGTAPRSSAGSSAGAVDQGRRARSAPVVSTAAACPAPGRARIGTLIPVTSRRDGRAGISTTTPDGTPVAAPGPPGTSWAQDVRSGAPDSYTVRATGAYAAGLAAERTTHEPEGDDRGLAGVRCAEPALDRWFLAPGPADAKDVDLYITNVDAQPAAVDITALSGEGPLDTTDGRGVPVAPHSTRVVRVGRTPEGLGQVVAGARVLGLRVRATTGRVAAAVRARVDKEKGVDWVPAAPAPAGSLVVPGIPAGSGRRQLMIAVPGEADARIQVQAITPSGAFAPAGQAVLDAPAQTVTPVDHDRALGGKPAALRLVSDQPIIAGFAASQGADVAYGAATAALDVPGAVADNRAGRGYQSSVLVTAPGPAATVRVTAVTARGQAGVPQEVQVAAGRTVEVKLAAPPGGEQGFGAFIAPRPGSGPVYAARVMYAGKGGEGLLTVLPVVPARTTVPLPGVGDSAGHLTTARR